MLKAKSDGNGCTSRVKAIEKKNRSKFRLFSGRCIAGVILALACIFLAFPALAQVSTKFDLAPVILDGRPIFQVSSSGQFTAKERANLINSQLKDAVSSSEPVQVKVEERNLLPTILLVSVSNKDLKANSSPPDISGRYLLTVTQLDAPAGSSPGEQAGTWAAQIQQAVNEAQQQRSGKYIRDAMVNAIAILMGAIALHIVLGWFWPRTLRRGLRMFFPEPNPSQPNPPRSFDLLLNLTLASTRFGLWVATLLYITNLFPVTRRWSYQIANILIASFISKIFTVGQKAYSVTDLLILCGFLWGLIVVTQTATTVLRSRILEVAGINRGAQEAIAITTKYSLIAVGTIVLLQIWGLDLSSLTILASVLGVGIGFGLQDIAKNFGSGLVIILERPIQIGDFVEVGEYKGIVERIGGRSTVIRNLDRVSIIVPNSRFLEKELINWNHDNPVSGVRLPIGVSYNSDVNAVKTALLEAGTGHPDVLSVPPPQVLFKGFGDSALNFELRVWTAQPSKQFLIQSDLYYRIEANLRQHKIEIPFPQRDLNIRTGNLQVEISSQLEAMLLQLLQNQVNGHKVELDGANNGTGETPISQDSQD
ncbi:mechanosensitive ion channel [Kamptonema animale CS-326]|jgi:potassium efflux system protein|uniref:mechanosensitive ion channel family protein n=1 Tax=Kamptonema animale TaxID=92934 RepID=UPI00232D8B0A|nr:mechanosensitive ion channel domain-containing protein [Kamptonema animale]MDB9514434.1 mechanosensitive ion channel [Kamptonema animale CS-326]